MALAYHILAHKQPSQVERLVRVLHHPDDIFVLHLDRRAPLALHQLGRRLAAAHSNIVVQRPRAVLWGGSQIPDVQIEAMQLALTMSATWSHFINLSGQDFPLRSRGDIVASLEAQREMNFVSWFDPFETKLWPNVDDRLDRLYLHWPWLHRLLKLPGLGRRIAAVAGWSNRLPAVPGYRRPRPDFFRYYGGSNHVILSREGCAYVATNEKAQRIQRWLRRSAIPDESVFQCVFLNGPLHTTVVNRHLRHFEFPSDTPHPRTFRIEDFDRLIASEGWFARKFDEQLDFRILDRLDQHLYRTPP